MTSTQQAPPTVMQAAELVWSVIEAAGPDGVDATAIRERTGLSREQVKVALPLVLAMHRPVVDVDAALEMIGTRRLTGSDQAARRRQNGL